MSESEARAILSDLARNGQRKVASMLRTEGVRQRR